MILLQRSLSFIISSYPLARIDATHPFLLCILQTCRRISIPLPNYYAVIFDIIRALMSRLPMNVSRHQNVRISKRNVSVTVSGVRLIRFHLVL
jgi:hypothetical protein